MEGMGNPFSKVSSDLVILDTNDIVKDNVAEALLGLAILGQDQYKTYVTKRLERKATAIKDPIKRNGVALLGKPPKIKVSTADKTRPEVSEADPHRNKNSKK